MSSVGTYLRELRERRGISLDDIARATRIAPRHLEALEADAYDLLPAPVFTRGFIRAYCLQLNEPPDEALARYDSREGGPPVPPVIARAAPAATKPSDSQPRARSAVLVSFVLLVVLGMALFGVTLILQPVDRPDHRLASTAAPSPSVPPAADPPEAAPPMPPPEPARPIGPPATPPPPAKPVPPPIAPAPTRPPVVAAPVLPVPPAPAAPNVPAREPATAPAPPAATSAATLEALVGTVTSPYRLVARTSEATWIRVRTEDGRSSEENVPAGEVREWISNRPFVLTIGNAGGVTFELNGRTLPPLGGRGSVISRLVLPPEPH